MLKFVIPIACTYGEPLCDEVGAQFYLLIVFLMSGGQITPHVSNLLHNVYHTCMLRDLQTSTQAFLKFTTTQLA